MVSALHSLSVSGLDEAGQGRVPAFIDKLARALSIEVTRVDAEPLQKLRRGVGREGVVIAGDDGDT